MYAEGQTSLAGRASACHTYRPVICTTMCTSNQQVTSRPILLSHAVPWYRMAFLQGTHDHKSPFASTIAPGLSVGLLPVGCSASLSGCSRVRKQCLAHQCEHRHHLLFGPSWAIGEDNRKVRGKQIAYVRSIQAEIQVGSILSPRGRGGEIDGSSRYQRGKTRTSGTRLFNDLFTGYW